MILSTHLFCLLKLSTTPQLCPPLLLSYTFDVLNLIRQYNQLNTIRFFYYGRFTMRNLLCVIYYALYTMHYVLFTMHYTLCTMHYALCIIYYAICTMHYVFIRIHTYLLFYTYSYVFTISHGNPAKSRDFGTHA